MKEIKLFLNKHEFDLMNKQNKNPEIDFFSFISMGMDGKKSNFILLDYHDVFYGWVSKRWDFEGRGNGRLLKDFEGESLKG